MKIPVKHFVIFMALSIILNGCSVYYKKEVSFEEAYLSKKPTKLVTSENKKVHLKKIILKDSTYYGVYWHEGKEITFPLSNETHQSLRIKNRTASTFINVGSSILTLGIVGIVIFFTTNNDWKTTNQDSTY